MGLFRKSLAFLVLWVGFTAVAAPVAVSNGSAPPKWAYDPGPDRNTPMGRELIDIAASIPYMPGVSTAVTGEQKFRGAFGPIPWRMISKPNSVKILFIGQDGTHIAEAAGRPATAGFGGRAQDLAAYFGVRESAAFINAYAFTIKGQYGAFDSPVLYKKDEETPAKFTFQPFVNNGLWLMTQDQSSPIVKWRNRLIDWIIRNNKDSLRLVVLFGGAARDSAATYIISRGGQVGTSVPTELIGHYQVPEQSLEDGGGNNEFPVPVNRSSEDLYAQLLGFVPGSGKPFRYSNLEALLSYITGQNLNAIADKKEKRAAVEAAKDILSYKLLQVLPQMVFNKGGPFGNGLLHPGQLGGFRLSKMVINGKPTLSLKGLKLSDGSALKNDVLVAELPHPTALSSMEKAVASQRVAESLEPFYPYVDAGWKINPDSGMVNTFALGKEKNAYIYARTDIGPEYYDFGAPGNRMVSKSDASRMRGMRNVIVFGSRDQVDFDIEAVEKMTDAQPSKLPDELEMYAARPRLKHSKMVFDAGPPLEFARAMKETLDLDKIFALKEGKTWETDGIDAYYVKSHPSVRDYGHYRGTFKKPQVLILADPEGYDDLITARALTGTRGQYLHGLMEDLGVRDHYLLLKTVPFGMDGASEEDWKYVLEATQTYREKTLQLLFKNQVPSLILADGAHAAAEARALVEKILGSSGQKSKTTVIEVPRDPKLGSANSASDILSISAQLTALPRFKSAQVTGRIADIPRNHLSFYARLWEGTSGDRVINARDKNRGKVFAEVAPKWAYTQVAQPTVEEQFGVQDLLKILEAQKLPRPGETLTEFVTRKPEAGTLPEFKNLKRVPAPAPVPAVESVPAGDEDGSDGGDEASFGGVFMSDAA